MILIIAEKPKAAKKIAEALGDVRTKKGGTSYYYEVDGGSIVVASAVGHVYGLVPGREGYDFPIFDVVWKPSYLKKGFEYSRSYVNNLTELSKSASEIIIATDYDIEGGVIGFNILKFAMNEKLKNAKKMKFSTLTPNELRKSFDEAHFHNQYESGMIEAGLLRHYLDWFWGINLSRALIHTYKKSGNFMVLSTGRVQGPTLKILTDREREITKFKSFYLFKILAKIKGFLAKGPETEDMKKAFEIFNSLVSPAIVEEVKKNKKILSPPPPFNLTDLQTEASRVLKYTPKVTLQLAQKLYEDGIISYPRTSSQQLPKELDIKAILQSLTKVYSFAKELIGKKAHEGKKTDPAHPAIYPTGTIPRDREPKEMKLYDLIARRFMATFGEDAIRESTKIIFNISKYSFTIEGRKTLVKGYTKNYPAGLEETETPKVKKGDKIIVDYFELKRVQKRPPKRYSAAGLLKLMEKINLGTKATRADIIQRLYDRKYIEEKSIQVTELGESVISLLEDAAPEVVSIELTHEFEKKMDDVSKGKIKKEKIIEESKVRLTKLLSGFKDVSVKRVEQKPPKGAKNAGECECGGTIYALKSMNNKRYAKCFKCGKSWGLPQRGTMKILDKTCSKCKRKMIDIKRKDAHFSLCMEHGFA